MGRPCGQDRQLRNCLGAAWTALGGYTSRSRGCLVESGSLLEALGWRLNQRPMEAVRKDEFETDVKRDGRTVCSDFGYRWGRVYWVELLCWNGWLREEPGPS